VAAVDTWLLQRSAAAAVVAVLPETTETWKNITASP